jgi:hypothetical protein
LNSSGNALLLEEILKCQTVHDGAEHTHVVSSGSIHAALGKLGASEIVTATNYNCNFGARFNNSSYLPGNVINHIRVNAQFAFPSKGFTGKLEKYSLPATVWDTRPDSFFRCAHDLNLALLAPKSVQ